MLPKIPTTTLESTPPFAYAFRLSIPVMPQETLRGVWNLRKMREIGKTLQPIQIMCGFLIQVILLIKMPRLHG